MHSHLTKEKPDPTNLVKALNEAIQNKNASIFQTHIAKIDSEMLNKIKDTLLISAAYQLAKFQDDENCLTIFLKLLEKGANPYKSFTHNGKNTTPFNCILHAAFFHNNFNIVKRSLVGVTSYNLITNYHSNTMDVECLLKIIALDPDTIPAIASAYPDVVDKPIYQLQLLTMILQTNPALLFNKKIRTARFDEIMYQNWPLVNLIVDENIYVKLPKACQHQLLKFFLECNEEHWIQLIIKTEQCDFTDLSPALLMTALVASINAKKFAVSLTILKNLKDVNSDLLLLFKEGATSEIYDILLAKIGNIFKDKNVFQLVEYFFTHGLLNYFFAMLKEVDKTEVMMRLSQPLRLYVFNNKYHLPDQVLPLYQFLKSCGLVNAELITDIENFNYHLLKISAADQKEEKNMPSRLTTTKMIATLVENPQLSKSVGNKLSSLLSINFWDGGVSVNTWNAILKEIIAYTPPPDEKHGKCILDLEKPYFKDQKETFLSLDFIATCGFKPIRLLGRTILLENKDGNMLAVKIKKDQEKLTDLEQEAKAAFALREKAAELDLKSYFPQPVCVCKMTDLLPWIKAKVPADAKDNQTFQDLVGIRENYDAYIYKVHRSHRGYFTYLHDTSLRQAEFANANRITVNDLYKLLANGVVYDRLADIFHSKEGIPHRADKGRYIVMTDLISPTFSWEGAGSGRLTGWQDAVAYPNIRSTGLADLGDFIPLKDYLGSSDKVKTFYSTALNLYGNKVGNYLLANIIAEYQYVLYLIVGFRACKLTRDMTDEQAVEKIWQEAANQILTNCAQAISILTSYSEHTARVFLSHRISVEQLGIQMKFWMRETKDSFEYLKHVIENSIPEEVYGSKTKVSIDTGNFRSGSFDNISKDGKRMGFSIDHEHPDLGPVNGQEPIKEKDHLFAWMLIMLFNSYDQLLFTRMNLADQNKNGKDVETLRSQLAMHLPLRRYHATMFMLNKKDAAKTPDKDEKAYAAATLLTMWRAKKMERELRKESTVTQDKHVIDVH